SLCTSGAVCPSPAHRLFSGLDRAAAAPVQQGSAVQPPASGNGRVVVTIVVEGLRIPALTVELHDVAGNIAIAKTTSDAIGQLAFPDVPAGRYVVRAVRDGFADSESSP